MLLLLLLTTQSLVVVVVFHSCRHRQQRPSAACGEASARVAVCLEAVVGARHRSPSPGWRLLPQCVLHQLHAAGNDTVHGVPADRPRQSGRKESTVDHGNVRMYRLDVCGSA